MKLRFIGADHEVTGSCHLIEACGKNILVDCGMEQGPDLYENQEIPVLTGISGGGDFNLSFRLKTDKNAVSLLRQGKDISVDLDAEGRLTFVVKGVKVVSRQPVNNNKECIVSLCREKNGMLKIYLDGELEQSAYDVAIVNPGIKATPVIINASLENALGQLKLINRALDYKENKNMALK